MALNEMFPQMDLPMGPLAGYTQGIQFNGARNNQLINQGQALQDLFQNEQMNPLKIKQQQLQNDQTGLTNTGLGIKNEDAQMTLDMRKKAAPQEYDALVAKMATEIDDNQMKMFGNHIQRMAYSQDPKERAMAQDMFNMSKDIFAKRQELAAIKEREMAVQGLRNAGAERVANISQAGQNGRAAAKGGAQDFLAFLNKSYKDPVQRTNALLGEIARLEAMEPDNPNLPAYRAMAAAGSPVADAVLKAKQRPPGIDAGAATGMPTIPQVGFPGAASPAPNPATAGRPGREALSKIPGGAITMLKQNPALAAAFNAKYGPGMAELALGQ